VSVRVDEGRVLQFEVPPRPYVIGGRIATVVLGDDYFVAADVRDGHLVNLRHVHDAGPNTLRLKLEGAPDGHVGAVLTITSTFDDVLRYHAGVSVVGREGIFKTSACPVIKLAVEHWPEPVAMVALADLRVNDPGDMSCRE
jgi:hypothetical protein